MPYVSPYMYEPPGTETYCSDLVNDGLVVIEPSDVEDPSDSQEPSHAGKPSDVQEPSDAHEVSTAVQAEAVQELTSTTNENTSAVEEPIIIAVEEPSAVDECVKIGETKADENTPATATEELEVDVDVSDEPASEINEPPPTPMSTKNTSRLNLLFQQLTGNAPPITRPEIPSTPPVPELMETSENVDTEEHVETDKTDLWSFDRRDPSAEHVKGPPIQAQATKDKFNASQLFLQFLTPRQLTDSEESSLCKYMREHDINDDVVLRMQEEDLNCIPLKMGHVICMKRALGAVQAALQSNVGANPSVEVFDHTNPYLV